MWESRLIPLSDETKHKTWFSGHLSSITGQRCKMPLVILSFPSTGYKIKLSEFIIGSIYVINN